MLKEETSLSLQIFIGFEKEELVNFEQLKLLKYTDILLSGRFDNSLVNNNQKVYILNNDISLWSFNNSDIEIEIDEDGNIKAETNGMTGDICVSELEKILKNIDGKQSFSNNPEFYKKNKEQKIKIKTGI